MNRATRAPLSEPPGRRSGGVALVPGGFIPPIRSIDSRADMDVGAPLHLLKSSDLPGCGLLGDQGPSSRHQLMVGGCQGRLNSAVLSVTSVNNLSCGCASLPRPDPASNGGA